jgi:hypothetical protein
MYVLTRPRNPTSLGQLSLLRERIPFDRKYETQWRKAVSLAVTAN